jgi:hypothetical protein
MMSELYAVMTAAIEEKLVFDIWQCVTVISIWRLDEGIIFVWSADEQFWFERNNAVGFDLHQYAIVRIEMYWEMTICVSF